MLFRSVLTHKYFDGVVPAAGTLEDVDTALQADILKAKDALEDCIEHFHFRDALREAMNIARIGNKYLQETEPWKLAKTDMSRVATILNCAMQLCADMAIAFEPFMPFTSAKICKMLGITKLQWQDLGKEIIPAGRKIGAAELLFEKIEDEAIQKQLKRLEDIRKANSIAAWEPAPQQPDVDFDTFMKADLRVGTVKSCERVPKADKLLKFSIDDGTADGRTIVSGIAKYYNPEDLVGRQVCFIANLPVRRLRGVDSQGMILSAEDADGRLVVVGPTGPVHPGASVK